MNIAPSNLSSANLDHHGLVAAVCQDLGIAAKLNILLGPKHEQRVVSAGTSVVAMILNGLGFTNRRLYLTPQFFENKPVSRLLGEPVEAASLTDHTLGQTLDEIAAYGSSQLFAEVAFDIALEQNLLDNRNHLDTTTLSVKGEYALSTAETDSAPQLTYGHSKDHRPDLKQAVLSLTVNGPADMPLWMEVLDGNSSDKVNFHETIEKVKAFQSQVGVKESFKWVADSALYSKQRLLGRNDYLWLSRVPETLKESKRLVSQPADTLAWTDQGAGYQTARYQSNYGDIQQRWLLVYSEQAHQREVKTLERQLAKEEKQLVNTLRRLSNKMFACEQDAQEALRRSCKKPTCFDLTSTVERIEKYPGKGRPGAGAKKAIVGYRLKVEVNRNEAAIQQAKNRKGRFILATNDLDEQRCSDEQMLAEYKQQQGVERGFRFLKDPWFMVDSVFLKSPKRIEALMMVMTLCLLVYNVAQYRLRDTLQTQQETLPNQLNKPIQNPTLRWIFQLMEGISIVMLTDAAGKTLEFTTNLNEVRQKIIRFFGNTACAMYGMINSQNSTETLGM